MVRMETVEAKEKRLAEEKEREEKARKVEEERKAVEEEERRNEEKKRRQEEKKKAEEEAERKKKEEEERERIREEKEAKKAVEEERRRLPPTQAPRSPAFPWHMNLANGTGGGAGVGNKPSPAPNTPSTSGIQPGMSSLRLSAPPDSAHPGSPSPGGFHSHSHYPYYVSCAIFVTAPTERLTSTSFHRQASFCATRSAVQVPCLVDVTSEPEKCFFAPPYPVNHHHTVQP